MNLGARIAAWSGDLPTGYRKVKYLKSKSASTFEGQYVDTNWKYTDISGSDYFDIEVTANVYNWNNRRAIFGAQIAGYGAQLYLYMPEGNFAIQLYIGGNGSSTSSFTTGVHKFKLHITPVTCYLYIDGELKITQANNGNITKSYSVRLFSGRNGDGPEDSCDAMVYDFTISKNGKEQCHLVPCVRIADSKPGMYDKVMKAFRVNESGYGEFEYA